MRRNKNKTESRSPKLVIGVGASVGSAQALKNLLGRLKKIKKEAAFVVVQHLDKSQRQISTEILESIWGLPVKEVKKGVELEAGFIYWVPPHTLASLESGGRFKASSARTTSQKLNTINHLFSSLGKEFGSSSVGVILSGEANDGAVGIKEINESGGLTIVQCPDSTPYRTMPTRAIMTGFADHVLDPKDIPSAIEKNASYLAKIQSRSNSDVLKKEIASAIPNISDILLKHTQHDFRHYKISTLLRRIQRRMQVLRIDSVDRYLERLMASKEEAELLFKELLINVTSFFRDKKAFDALKSDVLEKLVSHRKSDQKIRIWVAGCSSGEEAYSIAILLHEIRDERKNSPEIQIIATDIDSHALSVARKGSYPSTIAENVPLEYLNKYFTKRGGRYHVNKSLREMCLFSIHNLINDPPFSQLDLITCRNVLIYMGSHLQKKLFPMFHYALRPNGYLFLGTSESLTSHKELFKSVNARHRIAQRKSTAIPVPTSFPSSVNNYLHQLHEERKSSEVDISLVGQKIALDEMPLRYAIVNDEGHIVSVSSGIGKYVEITEGPFQNNIIKLSRATLRPILRKVFALARKEKRKVSDESTAIKTENGLERVGVIVQPMPQLGEESELYWVAFQYLGAVNRPDGKVSREQTEADHELIEQLEREVSVLREDLDKTVQDLEASNEELKSSNEELLSMNEELQSANEELEASKEEVQLVNDALHRANADLENLLAGTQIATLFLDDEMKIRSFTPAITEIYRIRLNDIGRDIRDFTSYALDMPPYPEPQTAISADASDEELRMPDGKIYQRRILPYRTHDNSKDGIVVNFVDVTNLRLAEMQYRELADSMPNIVWTTDPKGSIDYLNARWYEFSGYDYNLSGNEVWLPLLHPDDVERWLQTLKKSLDEGSTFEMEYRFWDKRSADYRWFLGRAVPVKSMDGQIKKWVGTAVDIHDRVLAEEARRESEKLFQLMANAAPVLVWISGLDKSRNWFNKGWFDFTGQTFEEAFGEGWRNVVHPDDLDLYVSTYNENFETRTPFYIEYRLRHRSGNYRWIGARGVPRLTDDGHFEGFIGACLDIHEQKTAREILAESRRNLETMIQVSPAFICVLSGPEYVFEQANEQYLKLVGHRDIIGKPILEALPEVADQGFIELLDKVRDTKEPYIGTEVPTLIEINKGEPLQKRYLDFVYQPHEVVNGEVQNIFVHGVDVTPKVLTRLAIENERENFRNLFKQTPEMVCILSGSEHRFEFVNEAHIRVLGFDATGMTLREAQPESVEVHGILDNVYRTGKTAELHEIPVTVSNRLRYFNLTYAARRDENGHVNGIMVLGTEVTNEVLNRSELEKAKQEAEVASRSKTQFLANMSHEIRTPLSAIVGFSELLQSHLTEDKPAKMYIERVSRNANHLGRLIDELLDLSKIEADKLEIERAKVDIDVLIEDVFSTMALRAQDKGLEFNCRWSSEKPSHVITDPVRLSQILTNIVGNAVKFTERGAIDIDFHATETKLTIRVADTGIGLTEEQQERIFEPFMQADASVTRKYGGTGLGLALSKRLSKLLGGDLFLEKSAPDQGSVFRIEVAIEWVENAETEDSASLSQPMGPETLQGKSILIVDDSPDNRVIVRMFLQELGATVKEAANGSEGVRLATEEKFDLILMDIQMPVMDGYQAIRKLQELGNGVPVAALTAHAFKEERDRCLSEGFVGYITKPVNRNDLQEGVVELIQNS